MANNNATLRQVVYDLMGDFKQLYDDADFTPFKILYWVLIHADKLKREHVAKLDSGAYITPFILPVLLEPVNGRNYFELPGGIYDLDNDAGIAYMTYDPIIDKSLPVFASTTFTRISIPVATRLYWRDDEIPTPDNPYFYRLSDRIYLLGTEQINITSIEVGLKMNLNPNDVDMDIDQPFEFPQHLLGILKRQVLDMGRFVLQIPKDMTNDGAGMESKGLPQQKLVSVNPQVEPSLNNND